MGKKFWIAFPITFILIWVLQFILHAGIMGGFYAAKPDGFLPENIMKARWWWLPVGFLILAFIWTYLYSRFAPEKYVGSGIHHGVVYMIFLYVPWGFINYATLDISGYYYLWSTIGAIVQGIILGAIMGFIMKERPAAIPEPVAPPPEPAPAPQTEPTPEAEKAES